MGVNKVKKSDKAGIFEKILNLRMKRKAIGGSGVIFACEAHVNFLIGMSNDRSSQHFIRNEDVLLYEITIAI